MKLRVYIALGILCCLTACREADVPDVDRSIRLSAIVEGRNDTRAPYTETAPSQAHELHAAVWASTETGLFPDENKNGSNDHNGEVKMHTKANFQDSEDQLLIDAIYPVTGNDVYFVAMHPENLNSNEKRWTYVLWQNDNQEDIPAATTTFDGSVDAMYAPQVIGRYGDNAVQPLLHFHHLLTWLRIEMVANTEDARDAWGEVTNMTIKSNNKVIVDLSHGAAKSATNTSGYDRNEHVYFSNPIDMGFFSVTDKQYTDEPFLMDDSYTLKGPKVGYEDTWESFIEEVAYVMCAPVTASADNTAEYTLTIKTANRGEMQVPIDLMKTNNTSPFTGNTMGHQFTILLKFKIGENISVSAKTTPWRTGGISSGKVEE